MLRSSFEKSINMSASLYMDGMPSGIHMMDEMLSSALKSSDNTLDPFWLTMAKSVLMGIILNHFEKNICYVPITTPELIEILSDNESIKTNISELIEKLKTNKRLQQDIILETLEAHLNTMLNTKSSENLLKSAAITNILFLNNLEEDKETTKTTFQTSNKKQTIECISCGHKFVVDWSSIPETEKTVHFQCPVCKADLKRGNPFTSDKTNKNNNNNKKDESIHDNNPKENDIIHQISFQRDDHGTKNLFVVVSRTYEEEVESIIVDDFVKACALQMSLLVGADWKTCRKIIMDKQYQEIAERLSKYGRDRVSNEEMEVYIFLVPGRE